MKNNLNALIQYLYDSVNGLTECANKTKSNSLKRYITKLIMNRQKFISDLKSALKFLHIKPVEHGTFFGPLHRLYIDIKAMMVNSSAESFKKEILRGDEILITAYNETLNHETHKAIQELLSEQLHDIHQSQTSINELATAS